MRYLGIDPGKSGGIAVIGHSGEVHVLLAMPDTEKDIRVLLASISCEGNVTALIEKIQPFARFDGSGNRVIVSGLSKLSQNYGFLRGVLTCCDVPFDEIPPDKWRKLAGIEKGGDYKDKKQKAQQLYPGAKITNMTADALLIAHVAMMKDRGLSAEQKEIESEPEVEDGW
jgi:hypothetical protein